MIEALYFQGEENEEKEKIITMTPAENSIVTCNCTV